MEAQFNIFKTDGNGELRFVEGVQDLAKAKARVLAFGKSWPGRYVIVDEKSGERIGIEVSSHGVEDVN